MRTPAHMGLASFFCWPRNGPEAAVVRRDIGGMGITYPTPFLPIANPSTKYER